MMIGDLDGPRVDRPTHGRDKSGRFSEHFSERSRSISEMVRVRVFKPTLSISLSGPSSSPVSQESTSSELLILAHLDIASSHYESSFDSPNRPQ